jgi:2,3-bisphosphoglycerate-independent phosphoglycerate mutase
VWKHGRISALEPPHDHLTQAIGPHLPQEDLLRETMERSFEILNRHPLNLARAAKGENKGNSLWFWGAGTRPHLGSFTEKTGLKGAMISAVDLLKGIAVGAGMQVVNVEGATGSLHTNYEGKAQAAVKALLEDGCDLVYIHVEAPDEMGHQGSVTDKVKAIEYLDSRVIAPVKAAMDDSGEDYRLLIMPDHPTPICIRTHSSDPVPYIIYDSRHQSRKLAYYTEKEAAATGVYTAEGYRLMERFLQAVSCEV